MKHLKLKTSRSTQPGLSISASYVIVIPVTDAGLSIGGLQITVPAPNRRKEKKTEPDKSKLVPDSESFELTPSPDKTKSDQSPDDSVGSFVNDWIAGKVENSTSQTIPFCPCLGSSLFKVYVDWLQSRGIDGFEQSKGFIGCLNKIDGWSAGVSQRTMADLKDGGVRNRKMVVPLGSGMKDELRRQAGETKARWLARGFFAFEESAGTS